MCEEVNMGHPQSTNSTAHSLGKNTPVNPIGQLAHAKATSTQFNSKSSSSAVPRVLVFPNYIWRIRVLSAHQGVQHIHSLDGTKKHLNATPSELLESVHRTPGLKNAKTHCPHTVSRSHELRPLVEPFLLEAPELRLLSGCLGEGQCAQDR